MPQDSPLPLPSPTTQRDGWRVDRHGRIFARVLTSNERPFNAYGLSPAEKLAVVSFYEGSPSIDVPYSIERFYPNREYYYHVRMEVILVPAWAQDSSPGIERTLQTWERLYPEDGFPPGAKRYYHFYVSICDISLLPEWTESQRPADYVRFVVLPPLWHPPSLCVTNFKFSKDGRPIVTALYAWGN